MNEYADELLPLILDAPEAVQYEVKTAKSGKCEWHDDGYLWTVAWSANGSFTITGTLLPPPKPRPKRRRRARSTSQGSC